MNERRSLPNTPDSTTTITGNLEEVFESIDLFFKEVLTFLNYNEKAAAVFTEVQDRLLALPEWLQRTPPLEEDFARLLFAKQDTLVASAMVYRDGLNNVRVCYAHYLCEENIRRATFIEPK